MQIVMNDTGLKVLISDDSPDIRRHLAHLLNELPDIDVIGSTENVAGTLTAVRQKEPHVVILDISFPDGSGIDALKHIKQEQPDTEVIMLTNHANSYYRRACISAGARFFFDKTKDFERIGDALQEMQT